MGFDCAFPQMYRTFDHDGQFQRTDEAFTQASVPHLMQNRLPRWYLKRWFCPGVYSVTYFVRRALHVKLLVLYTINFLFVRCVSRIVVPCNLTNSALLGNLSNVNSSTFHMVQIEFDNILNAQGYVPLAMASFENSMVVGDVNLSRYDVVLQSTGSVHFLGTSSFAKAQVSVTNEHSQVKYSITCRATSPALQRFSCAYALQYFTVFLFLL